MGRDRNWECQPNGWDAAYLGVVFCNSVEDGTKCAVCVATLLSGLLVLWALISVTKTLGSKVICVAKRLVYAFQVLAGHKHLEDVSGLRI